MTLVDAGPLIALLDSDDPDHQRCMHALPALEGPLVTTWPAFTEATYLLGDRAGWPAQERLWRLVLRDDLLLLPVDGPMLQRARDLMRKYRDLPMDLADATLVAVAESKRLRTVFTLDADFRVYRLPGSAAFEIVP